MFGRQVDPASLEGDDLTRWYQRSLWEVEKERQAAAAQRYTAFFGNRDWPDREPAFSGELGPSRKMMNPEFSRELGPSSPMVDPGFDGEPEFPRKDIDPGFSWTPVGPNRWRSERLPLQQAAQRYSASMSSTAAAPQGQVGSNGGRTALAANRRAAPPPEVPKASVAAPRNSSGESRTAASGPGYRAPATPPPPSFFSSLFGGPVPLTSPEGNVIGYYDHQAAKAGLGLTAEYSAVAPLFHPAGWMDALLAEGGPAVTNAIRQGIEDAVQSHHTLPRFMGGAADQELAPLRQSLHVAFHKVLHPALKELGFPNVGGRAGSAKTWAEHFRLNPGSRDKAIQALRDVSRDFDEVHGTSISHYLDKELARIGWKGGQK